MRLPRRIWFVAPILGLAILAFVLVVRPFDSGGATASDTPPALPDAESALLIYREFGPGGDTYFAANPADPASRVELATVAHAWGYATYPSLAPDGSAIAYTLLPLDGGDGELRLLDIATGDTRTLAVDVDPIAPVWSPESSAVIVRRTAPKGAGAELVRVDLEGSATTLVAASAGLFPIEVSPDGVWIYFASLTNAGTDAARAPMSGGSPQTLAHLSDGVARDWDVSPDGEKVAYLAQTDGPITFVAEVRDLNTGATQRPVAGTQFAPVWRSSGALTVGRLDPASGGGDAAVQVTVDGAGAAAAPQALAAPGSGFDVPISWSPAGDLLVVRSFLGSSAADPGPSRLVVIGADGSRTTLSTSSDVAVAGWLEVAP